MVKEVENITIRLFKSYKHEFYSYTSFNSGVNSLLFVLMVKVETIIKISRYVKASELKEIDKSDSFLYLSIISDPLNFFFKLWFCYIQNKWRLWHTDYESCVIHDFSLNGH